MRFPNFPDENLAQKLVFVTEQAALAAYPWRGKENGPAADRAATAAMRQAFSKTAIAGTVLSGEADMGELDHEHGLVVGEKVGRWAEGDRPVFIYVDPCECTTALSRNLDSTCTVMAFNDQQDGFITMPDMYMYKIAVGPKGRGLIDITAPPSENVRRLARAKGVPTSRLTVAILNRTKHLDLMTEVAQTGAQVMTFPYGDLMMGVATAREGSGIDMLIGEGGAPEGLLTLAALECMGGELQGLMCPSSTESDPLARARLIEEAENMMRRPIDRPLRRHDMIRGNTYFAATGVLNGRILPGIRTLESGAVVTTTLVSRSSTRTVRWITTEHPPEQSLR